MNNHRSDADKFICTLEVAQVSKKGTYECIVNTYFETRETIQVLNSDSVLPGTVVLSTIAVVFFTSVIGILVVQEARARWARDHTEIPTHTQKSEGDQEIEALPSKALLGTDEGGTEHHGKLKMGAQKEMVCGYDCEIVDLPASAYQTKCPICHLVLRYPYLSECCGVNFCQSCGERIRAEHMPCPTCRKANFRIFPNLGLANYLNKLCVSCTSCKPSCNWCGELGELEYHLNEAIQPGELFQHEQLVRAFLVLVIAVLNLADIVGKTDILK